MTDALPPMQMGSVALFFLVNLLLTNLTEILAQRGKEDNCYINGIFGKKNQNLYMEPNTKIADSGFVCCSKILGVFFRSSRCCVVFFESLLFHKLLV